MQSAQIQVFVSSTGEIEIKTVGFNGPQCREATKELEAVLGQRVSETLTTEYHQLPTQEINVAGCHDARP